MNSNLKLRLVIITAIVVSSLKFQAQNTSVKFGKGVSFMAKDSSMSMKLTFRFQSLFVAEQTLDKDNKLVDDFASEAMIRRSRIKFDGFVYSPKLEYKVELAISNRDVGLGGSTTDGKYFNNASNIVLDAVLKYEFAKNTEIWFGQTKLPSNRERVISSQKLQFVDRSIANGVLNLDRDFGFHLRHKDQFGNFIIKETGAMTLGEGRNVTSNNDDGFCYTGRLEFLPFGEFKKDGDYVGSDVEREEKPKLAIGVIYDYNDNARRTIGQLGSFIKHDSLTRDLQSIHADFMYKHKGFSAMGEYMKRFIAEGEPSVFYVGTGYNIQAGYLLKNNIEFAGRFSQVRPDLWDKTNKEIYMGNKTSQVTLGFSKYFVKHNLKIQSDISASKNDNDDNNYLMYRFQVEMQF
ncbi:MAG: porin [Bacteroidia bacterium]